jgi:hypothetical protein
MGSSLAEDPQSFYQLNLLVKRKQMLCALSDEQKNLIWSKEYLFSEDIENSAESREAFHALFQKESVFFKDFKRVVIAYHSPRSLVVDQEGMELFDSVEDAVAVLLKRYPTDHLQTTVLANSPWVHCTFLPKSIQLELSLHFAQAQYTTLLATLHSNYTKLNYQGDHIFFFLEEDYFHVHCYRNNLLFFVKSFPMVYHEDLIYHLTSVKEGYDLSVATTALHLLGKSSYSMADLRTKLQEFFPNTHILLPSQNKSSAGGNLQALYTLIQCA